MVHYNVPNSRLLFPNLSQVNPVYVVPSYTPRRPIYALVFQVVFFIQLSQPQPFVHVFSPPHVPKSRRKWLQNFREYNIAVTKNQITSSVTASKVIHILRIIRNLNLIKLRITKQQAAQRYCEDVPWIRRQH